MDNPFLCGPKALGQHWRALRERLTADMTDAEQLDIVARFWSMSPISPPFLDWDHPNAWPDPWQLMSEMTFDVSSKALGMEYTLMLGHDRRWTPDRMRLSLVCMADKSQQFITLVADDAWLLNYDHRAAVTVDNAMKELVIQQRYEYINKVHRILD